MQSVRDRRTWRLLAFAGLVLALVGLPLEAPATELSDLEGRGTQALPTESREAREQDEAQDEERDRKQTGPGAPSPFRWLGPDRFAGRIRSVLVHPANRNIIYAGAATGGVWKTTDGGQSWSSLDDFMPTQVIGSLAMDPNDPSTIYAGTGEIFTFLAEGLWLRGQDRGQGIFVSRDGGTSWKHLTFTRGADWRFVSRVAVSPNDSRVILAATGTGLFRSINGGDDFTRVAAGNFLDVKFHPTRPSNVVATALGNIAVVSQNGGASWNPASLPAGLPNGQTRIELAPVATPGSWRAIHLDRSTGNILLLSSDSAGADFTLMRGGAPVTCDSRGNNRIYSGALWVDPRDPQKMVLGGVFLCKSTDGGQTFTRIPDPNPDRDRRLGSDFHAVVEEPGFAADSANGILVGYDQGLHRIRAYDNDPPLSLENLNNGLRTTQFHSAVAHRRTGNVIGGLQDNGVLVRAGTTWRRPQGIEDGGMATLGGDTFFFTLSVGRVFRSAIDGTNQVCFSATGASPLAESLANPNRCGSAPVNTFCGNKTPLLVDPNNSNRLYAGCGQLWRTTNAGTAAPSNINWTSVQGRSPGSFVVNAMDIAKGNANLMWLGTIGRDAGNDVGARGQLWRSTTAVSSPNNFVRRDAGLPNRPVFDVVIDPRDHQKAYVSFSGFFGDNVWKTANGGTDWTPIGAGLPSVPVWTLAVHPTKAGWLYAGTDVGLYTSTDDGATWSSTSRGPSTVAISDLQWKGNTTFLTVATYGRGTHELDARPNPELLFPETATVVSGTVARGHVENLIASDDKRLVLSTRPLSRSLSVILTTRGGFTQTDTPFGSDLDFVTESVASRNADQKLELFDFLSNRFVTMQIVPLTAGQERTTTRTFGGGAGRFINPTTRQLRARITWTRSTPSRGFSVEIDVARWRITRP